MGSSFIQDANFFLSIRELTGFGRMSRHLHSNGPRQPGHSKNRSLFFEILILEKSASRLHHCAVSSRRMRLMDQEHSAQVTAGAKLVLGLSLALALFLTASSVSGQQLPVRTYTTADGLPRDLVLRIVRDSHGFLWFCSGDGLSRFNGYEFTNYGVEQGLPHPVINDLLETRRGVYWVATNGGGVARFNPAPSRDQQSLNRNLFTAFPVGDG